MTLDENIVEVDRRDAIAIVTLSREAKQNALNAAMVTELSRVFAKLQSDSGVRAVILTGAGMAFSAGADIEELMALTPEQAQGFARAGQSLTSLIEDLGKPVIAAVNGLAFGGGCELALAGTWRIASPRARFAQPMTSLGLMPGFGAATRLPKAIGKARALEMILTGEPISAEEAWRIGLVNRVVSESEDLLRVCEELACQISRNAPLAIKYALEAVNHGSEISLAYGLRLESALFGLCFATEDVEEGTKAFLEKRQPIFKGQ